MVKTFGDNIFSEFKKIGAEKEFKNAKTLAERIKLMEQFVGSLNITKSSLIDLDSMYSGTVLYLSYLIQSEYGVDMGLCPFFKMWINNDGDQYRCFFNKGPQQMYCHASPNLCKNPTQYKNNIESKMEEFKDGKN